MPNILPEPGSIAASVAASVGLTPSAWADLPTDRQRAFAAAAAPDAAPDAAPVAHALSDKARAILAQLHRRGAFQRASWWTDVRPAAAHKGTVLTKTTHATVRTGVEYANLAVNAGRETGPLPWGEWAEHPFIIRHKGREYVRLFVLDGSVRTTYRVNGQDVNKATFDAYLTPSARKPRKPHGGTITVRVESVVLD